jgi:hypothetical protein
LKATFSCPLVSHHSSVLFFSPLLWFGGLHRNGCARFCCGLDGIQRRSIQSYNILWLFEGDTAGGLISRYNWSGIVASRRGEIMNTPSVLDCFARGLDVSLCILPRTCLSTLFETNFRSFLSGQLSIVLKLLSNGASRFQCLDGTTVALCVLQRQSSERQQQVHRYVVQFNPNRFQDEKDRESLGRWGRQPGRCLARPECDTWNLNSLGHGISAIMGCIY